MSMDSILGNRASEKTMTLLNMRNDLLAHHVRCLGANVRHVNADDRRDLLMEAARRLDATEAKGASS